MIAAPLLPTWWALYLAGAMVAAGRQINRAAGRAYVRTPLLTHHVQTLRLRK